MRLPFKKTYWTVLTIAVATMLLATACGTEGPKGPQGTKGSGGDAGTTGDKGQQGDRGAQGAQGAQGPQGETGPTGDPGTQGETGDTAPTKIVLVPVDETTSQQPATVDQGSREPQVIIYGSGFPAGDIIIPELIDATGFANTMAIRDGDKIVTDAGTFKSQVRVNASRTLDPGVYTLTVTSLSGVRAAAPVIVAATASDSS